MPRTAGVHVRPRRAFIAMVRGARAEERRKKKEERRKKKEERRKKKEVEMTALNLLVPPEFMH
ncbi:hypothetical protein [Bradyrhizobium canariense]|uniref:hypothetical protein n=1 Tax=Bradyrhizobium canariense TaxID=255045 RepID=UPI0011774C9B|nr:hypothetical protein [Bradyrhizobium canariense]